MFTFIALYCLASRLWRRCCHISDLRQSRKFRAAALQLKRSSSENFGLTIAINQTSPTVSCERCLIVRGDNLHLVCHDCFASIFHPPTLPGAPSLTHSPHQPQFYFSFRGHPDLVLPRLLALSARVPGLHLSNVGRLGDKQQSFIALDVGLVWLFFTAGRLHV